MMKWSKDYKDDWGMQCVSWKEIKGLAFVPSKTCTLSFEEVKTPD